MVTRYGVLLAQLLPDGVSHHSGVYAACLGFGLELGSQPIGLPNLRLPARGTGQTPPSAKIHVDTAMVEV